MYMRIDTSNYILRVQYAPENPDSISVTASHTLQSRNSTLQLFTAFGAGNIAPSLVHVESNDFTGANKVNFLYTLRKIIYRVS